MIAGPRAHSVFDGLNQRAAVHKSNFRLGGGLECKRLCAQAGQSRLKQVESGGTLRMIPIEMLAGWFESVACGHETILPERSAQRRSTDKGLKRLPGASWMRPAILRGEGHHRQPTWGGHADCVYGG